MAPIHGWAELNGYRDTARNANVGTTTLALNPDIPLSYFGFVDFYNKNYWTEQNFRYRLGSGPLHASFQYVSASGLPVQLGRWGVLWSWHETPLMREMLASAGVYAMGVDFHLLEMDSDMSLSRGLGNFRRGIQLEPYIAGAIPKTSGRIFYEGWLDQDINWPKGKKFQNIPVSDFLVGAQLVGNPAETGALRLVYEGRYNDYFRRLRDDVPALKDVKELNPWGSEVGLSYFIAF